MKPLRCKNFPHAMGGLGSLPPIPPNTVPQAARRLFLVRPCGRTASLARRASSRQTGHNLTCGDPDISAAYLPSACGPGTIRTYRTRLKTGEAAQRCRLRCRRASMGS
jgi:hypothetical protein